MDRLVAIAVSRRYLMVGLLVAVIISGLIAFKQLNIEAYPDPTPPMVDIVTQSPGLSSEEIERYITIPIETQVSGIKHLSTMRTISLYGLSDVKLQFSFDYNYDEALQQVLNRLSQLPPLLGNVQPTISPLSAIGEIYRYRLTGPPNYSVLDLKTLQDWVLQRRFRAVPGVIDVTGWGGKTKTYELQVDFNKLIAYGITLPQLLQTLGNSNVNVGGNTVNIGSQAAVVRGVGLIRSNEDLRNTMLTQSGGNLRSAIIVGATIPFALAFAVGILVIRGESANLLSVGAIDFGLIVDATVIMVETIFRRLAQPPAQRHTEPLAGERSSYTLSGKVLEIFNAAAAVNRSIFFAAGIIIAAFIPLFTLSGVEGHIFGPMAKTYAYALAGGLIATFTVTPALCAVLLPEHVRETETWVVHLLHRLYTPVLRLAIANRLLVTMGAVTLLLLAVVTVRFLGLEFLPKLEEGNLWIRATMPATISLEEGNSYVNQIRTLIREFPEVDSVVSQHGRPDDGTDAAGFFNAEFFAPLKPASQWPKGVTKDDLTTDLLGKLQARFPGIEFNFSQYLQDNVAEAVSGVKGENSIKLFGNDLQTLTDTANKIKTQLATVQGITDLAVFTSLGQPTVQIDIDRARAARYGLTPGDINATIRVAIGGDAAGDLYEPGSDRHFPIIVRLAP